MVRVSKPAAQRKGEILDAAQTLFVTKGYQATTIEDILKAVGIAKGTLYHHFSGKEEVLRGLVRRTVDQAVERARAIAASDLSALEKLGAVVASAQVEGQSAELVEEFHAQDNSEFHLLSIVEMVKGLTPVLVDVVSEGVEEGVFATDDPLGTVEVLLTAGGFLLDVGIFGGDAAEVGRRAGAVTRAAEILLGCPEGALSALGGTQGGGRQGGEKQCSEGRER
mgnify:FL=1